MCITGVAQLAMYCISCYKLPEIFNSYYMLNNNEHSYNTRNTTKLHESRAKQAWGKIV